MSQETRSVILGEMLDRAGARLRAWNEERMEAAIRARVETKRVRSADEGIHAPDEEYGEEHEIHTALDDCSWGDMGC